MSFSSVLSHTGKEYSALYPTTQKIFSRYIPKQRKLSSVLSNNGGKSPVLYPSMEENLGRCVLHIVWNNENVFLRDGIRRGKTFRVVGCTASDSLAVWETPEENLLRFGIQRRKTCGVVSHTGTNPSALRDTTQEKHPTIHNLFSVVSHNEGESPPLYPTT
jgi:hypothetical protein